MPGIIANQGSKIACTFMHMVLWPWLESWIQDPPLPPYQTKPPTFSIHFCFWSHGVLVMFMAAGFAMLEAGMVRTKNVATICLKNIALYSLAGVMFWAMGYNLMYMDVDGGYLGTIVPWAGDNSATAAGDFSAGYSAESDWFFQMVFVATTASIISGTIAERVRAVALPVVCGRFSRCALSHPGQLAMGRRLVS